MFPVGLSGWCSFASSLYFLFISSRSFVSWLTPSVSLASFLSCSTSSFSLNPSMNSFSGFLPVSTSSTSSAITFDTMYRLSMNLFAAS